MRPPSQQFRGSCGVHRRRYRVIAYRIALESIEKRAEGSLVDGFPLSWIRSEVVGLWREGFRDDSSREGFATMLEEMIGLGILARTDRGNYALRSPNLLALLGTHDEVEAALLDAVEREPRLEYEATYFRRELHSKAWRRSPLNAAQESSILVKQHQVSVVLGTRLAGLDFLEEGLRLACGEARFEVVAANDHQAFVGALERTGDLARDGREREGDTLTLFVTPETKWDASWVQTSLDRLDALRVRKTSVRIIFAGDALAALRWESGREVVRDRDALVEHTLTRWSDQALRRWMQDTNVGPGDNKGARPTILNRTGGWPHLMHELGRLVTEAPTSFDRQLQRLDENITKLLRDRDLIGAPDSARNLFSKLAAYGEPMSTEDLCTVVDGACQAEVDGILKWADRMGYVVPVGAAWEIDPIVARSVAETGSGQEGG